MSPLSTPCVEVSESSTSPLGNGSTTTSPMAKTTNKRIRETDRRKDEALQTFKRTLLDREVDAYLKGADTAIDREAKRAYNIRSIVLLLVVLAVVLMPVVAIIAGLSPQDFGSYIAPITAIAGTVVGYWFGERGRTTTTGD
jgi:hypothetical protein